MISGMRLRSQLLVAMLAILASISCATLLAMRWLMYNSVARQVTNSSTASAQAFESIQRERERQLSSSAAMLSELPLFKALLTTHDPATIQDASGRFWKLSGADLLLLTGPNAEVLALHTRDPEMQRAASSSAFQHVVSSARPVWWYNPGHLFWLFARPVMTGASDESRLVGYVVVGYDINSGFAAQLAQTVRSDIALGTRNEILASTLEPSQQANLQQLLQAGKGPELNTPREVSIGGEKYEVAAISVQGDSGTQVISYVLMPLKGVADFVSRINYYLLTIGIAGVFIAMLVVSIVSRAITRPLDNLVSGVRALARGDFEYSISAAGSSEIQELRHAFSSMRLRLVESQRQRIETEQMAVLARTAGSISHDLRHYLAAVVANAEFLHDAAPGNSESDEIYSEIKAASDSMAELIESLRELTGEAASLTIASGKLDQVTRRAVNAVRSRPEFRDVTFQLAFNGAMQGMFDLRKIERALFNIVLNACEAVHTASGTVSIATSSSEELFFIQIADNGPGIPASIKGTLFDPFVSSDKPSGTGLGLAIAKKIIRDHGGAIEVEASSPQGTTIAINFPRVRIKEVSIAAPTASTTV